MAARIAPWALLALSVTVAAVSAWHGLGPRLMLPGMACWVLVTALGARALGHWDSNED